MSLGQKFFSLIWWWKTFEENVIMDNPPLANRTEKDVSTETDNDVTTVPATANTRPRTLRPETMLGIVYGMKGIFIYRVFIYSECTRHFIKLLQYGMARVSCGGWLSTQYGTARVGGKGIIRTHQVEGRGQTGRIRFVFWNVHFNCTAAAEKAP